MIISPGRNYIFVHIPKTGGTALSLALEGRAMADDILIGDTPKAKKRRSRVKDVQTAGRLWKHSTLADIEGLIEPAQISDMFLFTLVRNPWDRVVSYYHWLRDQTFDHPAVTAAKTHDFDGFLRVPEIQASLRHPYDSYMRNGRGEFYEAHYTRLEHLEADLTPVWDQLGFDLSPIERSNVSDRRADYRTYYTDETRNLVGELCAQDIERFRYDF